MSNPSIEKLVEQRLALPVNCKFCGEPGYLHYPEPYGENMDKEKVSKMAACTSCLDNRRNQ